MHSLKAFDFYFGERGSNMWPSNLHGDTLPTDLSPLHSNERLDIRVSYINFLPRLTIQEVALNSEYHATHKYPFMVSF